MFKIVISEDTFTPWARKKTASVHEMEEQLLNALRRLLIQEVSPFVPVDQGYLQESPNAFWEIVNSAEGMEILVEWTGEANPDRWDLFIDRNGRYLDYAYWQYLYATPRAGKHNGRARFVDIGLESIEENPYYWETMSKMFLEWLFK